MIKGLIGVMGFMTAATFLCIVISLGIESPYGTSIFTLMFWAECYALGSMVAEYRYQKRIKNGCYKA